MRIPGPATVAVTLLGGAVAVGFFTIVGQPIEVVSRSAGGAPASQQVFVSAFSSNSRAVRNDRPLASAFDHTIALHAEIDRTVRALDACLQYVAGLQVLRAPSPARS